MSRLRGVYGCFKGYIRTQWHLRESQGHLRYFKGVLRDLRSISRRSHGISEDTSMSQGCLRGSSFGSVANQYCAKENVKTVTEASAAWGVYTESRGRLQGRLRRSQGVSGAIRRSQWRFKRGYQEMPELFQVAPAGF